MKRPSFKGGKGLFVEKDDRVTWLIWGAGGDIIVGKRIVSAYLNEQATKITGLPRDD